MSVLCPLLSALSYIAPGGCPGNRHTARPQASGPPATRQRGIITGWTADLPGRQDCTSRVAGPFGLAVSPNGRIRWSPPTAAPDATPSPSWNTTRETVDRSAICSHATKGPGGGDDPGDWRSVFLGVAFADEHAAWVSEGNSGRCALMDLTRARQSSQGHRSQPERRRRQLHRRSGAGCRALLALRARPGEFPARDRRSQKGSHLVLASTQSWAVAFRAALPPDKPKGSTLRIWACSSTSPCRARMPNGARYRPAVSRPSVFRRPKRGRRQTGDRGAAPVDVPGLGDPNVRESNSLCVVNVAAPRRPRSKPGCAPARRSGRMCTAGSSPSGILAVGDRVFVSNANDEART